MEGNFAWIIAGAAIVVSVLVSWRAGREWVPQDAGELISDIEAAAPTALEWVKAAQELYQTGELKSENRTPWVLERLKAEFPWMTEDTLRGAVKAGVATLRMLRGDGRLTPAPEPSTDLLGPDWQADPSYPEHRGSRSPGRSGSAG